jgi:tRNA pseudouridine32 synthase/23S rRNA pseudouridine746 synthase
VSYKLVFENEHFLIVDKNALVLSVPARENENDPRPVLGRILEADFKQTLFPVHRLDYEVQGLIMFARNPAAHKAGNAWFEKKEVTKTYCALSVALNGTPDTLKPNVLYEWKCRLLRGKKRAYESPHGKDSHTKAVIKKIESGVFHWELNPITGRSHQLRFELFRHGHPILGDELYSSDKKFNQEGIALRAFIIDLRLATNVSKFLLPEIIKIDSF